MEFISEYIVYWPFFAFMLCISIFAQVVKSRIITVSLANSSKIVFWVRRLFPLILLGMGGLAGIVWPGEPSPGVTETAHKVLYFMGSSGASIVGYNSLRTYIKKRYELDVGIPQESLGK